uniref:Uncharacterized protein n=1 Tax=Oryza meridionalis TaxID=40149 RepID=A0A0E0D770_9ORYZ
MRGGGGDDLWAKAAELERQFEGYKRRVAERRSSAAAAVADRHEDYSGDGGAVEEVEVAVGKGRRYDAYVRRRDEKLRQGWRARMERKEAEMKALWARLDVDRRRDGDLAAGNGKQQKPGNLEARPAASPATPRSSSATKATLSRPRATPRTTTPSPAGAAASPRLSSNPDARRRAPPQAEPPSTPRKENRVPSAAVTATPRLRALSRSRSSLKESASFVRDSPRRAPPPPPPRHSHDGDAGDRPNRAPTTADDAVAPVATSCQSQQVVLAEIKAAAAFRLRRSGNGSAQGRQPAASPRPVFTRQLDGRRRPSDTGKMSSVQISRNSDVEAKNFNLDEGIGEDDDGTARSSVELGSLKITGDSDTEPSYVYITKDIDEETMNTSQPQPLAASDSNSEEPEAPAPHQSEKETGDLEETAMAASSEATAKESPATDHEDASPQSSDQSFYSNVDSSFSHRSELELAASATDSPLHGSPSSTEKLLEADAAMLRKKREEEEEEDDDAAAGEINSLLIPSTTTSNSSSSVAVQSPMEAVAGLKRFLTFGKKNNAAAAVAPPADDSGVGHGWPSGDSGVRQRICSSDAASDDSDNSYVIPAHVTEMVVCSSILAKLCALFSCKACTTEGTHFIGKIPKSTSFVLLVLIVQVQRVLMLTIGDAVSRDNRC